MTSIKGKSIALSQADFEKIKQNTMSAFLETKPKNLDKALRAADIIWNHDAKWDWFEQMATAASKLQKSDLVKIVDETFGKDTSKSLTIMLTPEEEAASPAASQRTPDDINAWKKNRAYK